MAKKKPKDVCSVAVHFTAGALRDTLKRMEQLEDLVQDLTLVVEDFLPNTGRCVLQDYGRLNDVLLRSQQLVGKPKKGK